jgi:NADP-dependent 3-hydroxy acid dehydrogenase YdfG
MYTYMYEEGMEMPERAENGARRVAAVTGASSGVGAAIAESFAAEGWSVAIGARRGDRLEALAARLRASGGTVLPHLLDVTDPASIEAFCGAVEGAFGPIDVLVNNAGTAWPGRVGEVDASTARAVIATTLTGSILMTGRVLRRLREQEHPSGDVIFISSDAAVDAMPLVTSYGAAKAGLEHFARCLRLELEGSRIRVGVLRIGQVVSEFTSAWPEPALGELLGEWQRLGVLREFVFLQPADVAEAALAMASQAPHRKIDFLEVRGLPPEAAPSEEPATATQATAG